MNDMQKRNVRRRHSITRDHANSKGGSEQRIMHIDRQGEVADIRHLGRFVDCLISASPLSPLDDNEEDRGKHSEDKQTTSNRQTDDDGELPLFIVTVI